MPIDLLRRQAPFALPQLPTLPTLQNYGAMGATTRTAAGETPPDLTGVWPTPVDITRAERERVASQQPWWAKVFGSVDIMLGGRAIRGAIRGMGYNSEFSPLEGFLRGLPGTDFFDANLDTSFADIRKAFGDYNADEGAGNFVVNLVGDLLLDPTTYLMPLGATAKAVSMATKADNVALDAAANALPALTRKNYGLASSALRASGMTQEQMVQNGLKAGMVFHIPFTDFYKPMDLFGLKSMSLNSAKAVDKLGTLIRMSPVTGHLVQAFGGAKGLDAEQYATFKALKARWKDRQDTITQGFLMSLSKMNPQFREQLLQDRDTMEVFSVLLETGGFQHLDDAGMLEHVITNREAILQAMEVSRRYDTDDAFKRLIDDAYGGSFDIGAYMDDIKTPAARRTGPGYLDTLLSSDLEDAAVSRQQNAIRKLLDVKFGNRPMRLSENMLSKIDMVPRPGVDIPFAHNKLAEVVPPDILDDLLPDRIGINASGTLAKRAQDTIRSAGFESAEDLNLAANGQISSRGSPTPEIIAEAQQVQKQVDTIVEADRLSLRDPAALLARRGELLARAGGKSLAEVADRRRQYQILASDAKARGDMDLAARYVQAQKAFTRVETEISTLEREMDNLLREPELVRTRFPDYTDDTIQKQIDEMKAVLADRVPVSEGERLAERVSAETLRKATVGRVLDWQRKTLEAGTDAELATLRMRADQLAQWDNLGRLDEAGRRERTASIKQQRDLIREGRKLGGDDLFDAIKEAAQIHVKTMQGVLRAERAAGLMNQGMEMYLPRIMNPAVRQLINDRFDSAMEAMGTGEAARSFMQGRTFNDLLTLEANILMETVGSQITGFKGLTEFLQLDAQAAEQTIAALQTGKMKWTDLIFGPKWANKVIRPLDPDVADFFLANPVVADYARIMSSGKAIGKPLFVQMVFDENSGLVKGSASMGDTEGVAELLQGYDPTKHRILIYDPEQNISKVASRADVMSDVTDYAVNARLDTVMHQVREHVADRVKIDGVVPTQIQQELDNALKHVDAFKANDAYDLAPKPDDTVFDRMVKMRLENVRQSKRSAGFASEVRIYVDNVMQNAAKADTPEMAALRSQMEFAQQQHQGLLERIRVVQSQEMKQAGDEFVPSAKLADLLDRATSSRQRLRDMADAMFEMASTQSVGAPVKFKLTQQQSKVVTRGLADILSDPNVQAKARELHGNTIVSMAERKPLVTATDNVSALLKQTQDELKVLLPYAEEWAKLPAAARSEFGATGDIINDMIAGTEVKGRATGNLHRRQVAAEVRAAANVEESGSWYSLSTATRGVDDVRKSVQAQQAALRTENAARKASLNEAKKQILGVVGAGKKQFAVDPAMRADEARALFGMENDFHVDWNTLPPDVQKRYQANAKLRLVKMDTDVYDNVMRHIKDITAPDTLRSNSIVRVLDTLRSWWSPATTLNPLYVQTRARDLTQNLGTLAMSGNVDLASLVEANRISAAVGRAMENGTSIRQELGDATIEISGVRRLLADVVEEFQLHGVVGSSSVRDAFADDMFRSSLSRQMPTRTMDTIAGLLGFSTEHIGTGRRGGRTLKEVAVGMLDPAYNPVYRLDNPVGKYGRGVARYGDDLGRTAAALYALQRGMSLEDAAAHAKSWMYGSGEYYTSVERNVLKRVIPFYGFMKWSTGAAVNLMTQNPKYLGSVSKVRDNAYRALGLSQADLNEVTPQFLEDNIGVPVINTPDGPRFVTFGQVLPVQALQDTTNAIRTVFKAFVGQGEVSDTAIYIARNMHPALKLTVENLTKRDMFSGRPLERFPGEKVEMFGIPMDPMTRQTLRNVRYLNDLDRLNVLDLSQFKAAVNAVPRGQRPGDRAALPTWVAGVTGSFSPIPVRAYQVDIDEDLRRARGQDEQELNKLKGFMRQAIYSPEGTASLKNQSKDNATALQKLIAAKLAEIGARQRIEEKYRIDPEAQEREQREAKKRRFAQPIRLTRNGYSE